MSSFVRVTRKKKKGTSASHNDLSTSFQRARGATAPKSTSISRPSSSSFQPKTALKAKGTRAWINGQTLTSSGLHDLDEVLGGGLSLGTLFLIKEDRNTKYYNVLLKYFVAEGFCHDHQMCCASTNPQFVEEFLQNLPKNSTLAKAEENKEEDAIVDAERQKQEMAKQDLVVAWQYKKYIDQEIDAVSNLSSRNIKERKSGGKSRSSRSGSGSPSLCHSYDFSKSISPTVLNSKMSSFVHINQFECSQSSIYSKTLLSLKKFLHQNSSSCSGDKHKTINVSRIALHSIGSPLWSDLDDPEQCRSLIWFLYSLRAAIRKASNSVVCLSIPSHILPESLMRKLEHLCDYVIHMESFAGDMESTGESEYGDYDGVIHIQRLSRLNTLAVPQIKQKKCLFKMKRRRMTIDRFSLPPESSRSTKSSSTLSCGKDLEF